MAQDRQEDDAPTRARRDDKEGEFAIVGKTVLINRSRAELFAFWRDFTHLPAFMDAIKSIEMTGKDSSLWTVKGPVGQTVTLETELTNVVENEVIGWRSVKGSQIETEGKVSFADAPGGRGTLVSADIGYKPPGGDLGRLFAKLFAAEPNIQARHDLKRFKMLMEAGEIATGASHKSKDGDE